jgi:hypothetical protein
MNDIITGLSPRQKTFIRYLRLRSLDAFIKDEPAMADKIAVLADAFSMFLNSRYVKVRSRYGIDSGMTIANFRQICEDRRIALRSVPRTSAAASLMGYYHTNAADDFREIYVRPGMPAGRRLMVAAHELAHHFLHHEQIGSGAIGSPAGFGNAVSVTDPAASFLVEMEADVFASMLLTGDNSKPARKPIGLCPRKMRAAILGGAINGK